MYREEVYLRGMFKFKGPELSQLVFSFAKKGIQADNLYIPTSTKKSFNRVSNISVEKILRNFVGSC